MSKEHLQQYRGIAKQLVQRAHEDPQFAATAKADPIGVLTAAGVSESDARQMLVGEGGEVSGYMQELGPECFDTTCWTSACPGTCTLTIGIC